MSNQNIASRHLTEAQWATVDAAITQLADALTPVLVVLAPDQRKRLVRMGDGSEAFCRKALDVAAENLALMRAIGVSKKRVSIGRHVLWPSFDSPPSATTTVPFSTF